MSNSEDKSSQPSSNFAFMQVWDALAELMARAQNAEANIQSDPRIAGFYARNALELMVETVFDIVERFLTAF